MKLPTVLILSGGFGTRVSEISGILPKCLIPINGVPFIEYQLRYLERHGIDKVVISTGYQEHLVKDYIIERNSSSIEIELKNDGEIKLGTGGALINCLDLLGDEFFVLYGDSYLLLNIEEYYTFAKEYSVCMAIYKNNNEYDRSNVKLRNNNLIYYDKNTKKSDFEYIDYGMLYFKKSSLSHIELSGIFEISDILNKYGKMNILRGYINNNRFFEVGSIAGIQEFTDFAKQLQL